MLRTYEGYWNDGYVTPIGSPIKIAKNSRIRIIEVEEQELKSEIANIEEELAFWAEIDRMAEESANEKLRIEDFPKVKFGREPILFTDDDEE